MNIALVHEWLVNFGGSERVIELLNELFNNPPIYTSVYNPKKMPSQFKKFNIYTSFLQKLPAAKTNYQLYLLLMPIVFEQFDLLNYDLVISNSHAFAKGIITKPNTLHICYCYTPTRYIWHFYHLYRNSLNLIFKLIFSLIIHYLRWWDYQAAQRPDYMIAISEEVRKRIKKYYHREAEVIYPPVRTSFFIPSNKEKDEDYFLIVSRFVPYKRIDLAIDAFNELGLPLKIIGSGEGLNKLRNKAKKNIEFIESVTDEELREYYQRCSCLIFPAEEDLGLTPVEAQACGKPVIGYRAGGLLETVIEGKTGEFFYPQTKDALINVIKNFNKKKYDIENIRNNALRFDEKIFKQKFLEFVNRKMKK